MKTIQTSMYPAAVSKLPERLHFWFDRIVEDIQYLRFHDGNPDGLSTDEARVVLTAALNLLDTDEAPTLPAEYLDDEDGD